MKKLTGAALVFQSGGPTAVINASLCGVIEKALKEPSITTIYGAMYGVKGILNEQLIDFSKINEKELNLLKLTPGAALGTARYHFEKYNGKNDGDYRKVLEVFIKYDIHYLFIIGGNDSMDTCSKLNDFFQAVCYKCFVIGVPKTIDNDLIMTDHTPGYASAAKYIATTTTEIYQDITSYDVGRVTILEVMGRDAGWLTAATSLGKVVGMGPDLIYLPEVPFDLEQFLRDVDKIYKEKQKVYIAVSEGIKDLDGEYFLLKRNYNNDDDFGHLQLGGVGMVLSEIINKRLKYPVRSIELNLPQRAAMHLVSKTDLNEAYMCGKKAVLAALRQETGKTIIMKRMNNYHIKYETVKTSELASKVKMFPKEWIISSNTVSSEFIDYITPLIKGEVKIPYIDGMPKFVDIKINKKTTA